MGSNYIITSTGNFISEDDLYHWGIKGQKWGVRRYQNPDGTLTAAGRKRYLNSDGTLNEKGKKKFGNSYNPQKRKTAAEMTDAELDAAISRARKEDEYNRLRPSTSPEASTKAKTKTMSKLIDDMVIPAVINSGKSALQSALDKMAKKYLGEKADPNSYEALKKTYDKLKLQKELDELLHPEKKQISWDEQLKQQTYEQNKKKYEKEESDRAEADRIKKEQEAAAERLRKQHAKNARDYVFTDRSRYKSSEKNQSSIHDDIDWDDWVSDQNGSRKNRSDNSGGSTVEGAGRSSQKQNSNTNSSRSSTVYDSDRVYRGSDGYYHYADTSVTDIATTRNTSSGRDWASQHYNNPISGYLPAPKEDDD